MPGLMRPTGAARLNRRHPLARYVVACYIPGIGDIAGRQVLEAPSLDTGPFGNSTPLFTSGPFPRLGYVNAITAASGFSVVVLGQFGPAVQLETFTAAPLVTLGASWKFSIDTSRRLGFTAFGVADYSTSVIAPAAGVVGMSVTPGSNARFYTQGSFAQQISVGTNRAGSGVQIGIGCRTTDVDLKSNCRFALVLYLSIALTAAQHASLAADPWQLLESVSAFNWALLQQDTPAPIFGSAPGIVVPTAAGGPAVQVQQLGSAPAPSAIAAAAGALVQVQVLAAQLAAVAPGAAGGAAVQAQVLGAALAPVPIAAPGAARVSADALQAAIAVVGVSAGAGALLQAQVLGAAPAAPQVSAAGAAARQAQIFGATPAGPGLAAAGGPLAQAHVFGAAPARVAVAALPAAIPGPVGEVTWSAWRLFVVEPEQRRFPVEAERRTFTISS